MALCELKPYCIDGINMKCSINVPSNFGVLENKNSRKPFDLRELSFGGCPVGPLTKKDIAFRRCLLLRTRTVDIQNHNLTL